MAQITFSESDIVAIIQVSCCLPDDLETNPVIYLTQRLRLLRRIRFDSPRLSSLQQSRLRLEDQLCQALAFELVQIGALTDQGLNVDLIAQDLFTSCQIGNPLDALDSSYP